MTAATRPRLAAVLLTLALLVIAACTPPPTPPPPATDVVATADPDTPVDTVVIPAGSEEVYRIVIPDAIRNGYDALYVELSVDLPLELRSSTNYAAVIASSASADYFAAGLAGLEPAAAAATATGQTVTPQAVSENRICLGSCIIFQPTTSSYHARVRNPGPGSQTVELYVYGYDLQDDTEPANDTRQSAPALVDGASGALELIGDSDFWFAAGRMTVSLDQVAGAVTAVAVVVNATGLVVDGPFEAGESFEVCQGEWVRLRAAMGRAAAPGASSYWLTTAALPPDPNCRAPDFTTIVAGANPNTPADSLLLPAGSAVSYQLEIPAQIRNAFPVVYLELDADIQLELRDAGFGNVLASSSSSDYFATGSGGLLLAPGGAGLTPQGVTTSRSCLGSCIIFEPSGGLYAGVVVNTSGSPVALNVYLYGFDLMDDNEPVNDAINSAPYLLDDDAGAIETIADIDYWLVAVTGAFAFDAVNGIGLQAHVVNQLGVPLAGPYSPGQEILVFENEVIRVRANPTSVAAPSARSSYFLELLHTLIAPGATRETYHPSGR